MKGSLLFCAAFGLSVLTACGGANDTAEVSENGLPVEGALERAAGGNSASLVQVNQAVAKILDLAEKESKRMQLERNRTFFLSRNYLFANQCATGASVSYGSFTSTTGTLQAEGTTGYERCNSLSGKLETTHQFDSANGLQVGIFNGSLSFPVVGSSGAAQSGDCTLSIDLLERRQTTQQVSGAGPTPAGAGSNSTVSVSVSIDATATCGSERFACNFELESGIASAIYSCAPLTA